MCRSREKPRQFLGNSARIKITGPSRDLIEEILGVLLDAFPNAVLSPILPSSQGGFHSFVNIREERR